MPNTTRFSIVPGDDNTGRVLTLASFTPAYIATLAITPNASQTVYRPAVLTGALTVNATLTTSFVGDTQTWVLTSDATSRAVTFGTGYVPNGTISPAISKKASIAFVYDGVAWIELYRTLQP